jgi:hypothetical protein
MSEQNRDDDVGAARPASQAARWAVVMVLLLAGVIGPAIAVRRAPTLGTAEVGARGTGPPTTLSYLTRWQTETVAFDAHVVRIRAGRRIFDGQDNGVQVHSDRGEPRRYTTLEVTWPRRENVSMRLNIYFQSDGIDWWASEIRVSDGWPDGSWVTVVGERFRTPLGQACLGDLHLVDGGARLDIEGLHVQAFAAP